MTRIQCVSPVDGRVYVERAFAENDEIQAALDIACLAKKTWRATPLAERKILCSRAVDAFVAQASMIAEELTWQMGRPITQSPGEVAGFEERARYLIDISDMALADFRPLPKPGFNRFIRREPLGVVFVIAPWNYPYLTAVNAVLPALLAGNTVVLKHSAQTPLCAERLVQAFTEAGLPAGVFQYLHLDHSSTERLVQAQEIDFIAFTGSVAGGQVVQRMAASRFVGVGLELGGKDPAYVRHDADLDAAVATLTDGAFFNSGQSCCGIERIYVAEHLFQRFVEGMVSEVKDYQLGRPDDPETTLGPMVKTAAADFVRAQIDQAVIAGASALVDPSYFPCDQAGTPYLAPQVLVGVNHEMRVMREESFGPVVGIMPVRDDMQAIELMNDSAFGLTASVFTQDEDAAIAIGGQLEAGTFFMNRCDYLDPALAWSGMKNSGRGCSLSVLGFEQLTRPKSYHLKRAEP
jgi:acyl-CoA reductase-like NAD-dependent aldehyde dehydrogenase